MSYTNLNYHIIFGTRNRQNLIVPEIRKPLFKYIGGIIRRQNGRLIEIGGVSDHLHLLCNCHQTNPVADFVQSIKANATRWIKDREEGHDNFRWQNKYGAFAVSKSRIENVARYIRNQEEHHRTRTFREEFEEFLQQHRVDYEEEHLWG